MVLTVAYVCYTVTVKLYCLHRCHDIASENGKFNASSLDYDENDYEDMDCNVKLEKNQCTEVILESSLCDQEYSQSSGIYEEIH